MSFTRKLTTKSVNNKRLAEEIDNGVILITELYDIDWNHPEQRERLVEAIEEYIEDEIIPNGLIDSWDVICDGRNNIAEEMLVGHFRLTIKFRQRNCLNVTQLIYDFDVNTDLTEKLKEYLL